MNNELCQISSWEDSAERQYAKMDNGDGTLTCECGKIFDSNDGEVVSPNPYALPVCPDCFYEWKEYISRG